jgi:transposase-like protein
LTHLFLLCSIALITHTWVEMRKSETLNLRLSTEFKQRLVQEAKKEKRSVTNYLEATLTKFWHQKYRSKNKEGRKQISPVD